jgi:NAD+ synthase
MHSDLKLEELKSLMKINPEAISFSLENFIKGYMEKLEREGVILGLSGGIDSAVVAALCNRAVGPKKTFALIMPEKDSEEEHIKDALSFAMELGIETKLVDITPYLRKLGIYRLAPLSQIPFSRKLRGSLIKKLIHYYERRTGEHPFSASMAGLTGKEFGPFISRRIAYYRIKHRMRMVLLYLYAELENRLVVGAANKTEYQIGYFVKHGCDDATDVMPLINLHKTQVRELARYLNIPSKIMDKPPSPDILPGILDEETIGIPYEKLDLILLAMERQWEMEEIAQSVKVDEKKVIYVRSLIQKSEHMRRLYSPPPLL